VLLTLARPITAWKVSASRMTNAVAEAASRFAACFIAAMTLEHWRSKPGMFKTPYAAMQE